MRATSALTWRHRGRGGRGVPRHSGRNGAAVVTAILWLLSACTAAPNPTGTTSASQGSPAPSPTAATPVEHSAAVNCASLATPLYQAVDPKTGRDLLTTSQQEVVKAAAYGFTQNLGATMLVSQYKNIPGQMPIHRMSSNNTFAWVTEDRVNSMTIHGFIDQGVNFYAATAASECVQPVTELTRGSIRRYATGDSAPRLVSDGWSDAGQPFFVAAAVKGYGRSTTVAAVQLPDSDPRNPVFSFAAIPDTQIETHSSSDPRLRGRSEWLVANRKSLDLRFAVQVGDLVDWDTPDHEQYQIAQQGLQPLEAARLPYFLSIGNHDSQATCTGGGACDARFTPALTRMTGVFNTYFSASRLGVEVGEFEPGKLDNTFTTVGAGGLKWLVVNLELWPRDNVIAWAADVVRHHPHYNVIITTHAFLDAAGEIDDQPNYGSTTSTYLFTHLIARYPNIKIVLCGHVGDATTKVLQGQNGNQIYTFLQAFHSLSTNPVRLIRVDTARQTIQTWIDGPATGEELLAPVTYTGVGFVK